MSQCDNKEKKRKKVDIRDVFMPFAASPPLQPSSLLKNTQSILRLSNLNFQMAHRLHDRVVLPIHVHGRGLMQRHVESTEEVCEREMELRV